MREPGYATPPSPPEPTELDLTGDDFRYYCKTHLADLDLDSDLYREAVALIDDYDSSNPTQELCEWVMELKCRDMEVGHD